MPLALLLSPDDQAVNAITGVLEEMSVTCERPLDGVSAAQKLNSQSFDLVLVDCENLPAAKLIFDVCRRGKNGHNPVPIAIVDGRAGLPTAFRLGAELILTKPVAKDQARSTIRTAVSRLRKDVPANESTATESAGPAMAGGVMTSAVMPEEHAQAAAASSHLTNFADPAPSFVRSSVPSSVPTAARAALSAATAPTLNPQSASFSASPLPGLSSAVTSAATPPPADSVSPKPRLPLLPSDDPVLAELERTEQEEAERPESPEEKSSQREKAAPRPTAAESEPPVFSAYHQNQPKKRRGPLVALLMLGLAAGGFYGAWTYQPGFREIAQPQIERVLALAGIASPLPSLPPTPHPAK